MNTTYKLWILAAAIMLLAAPLAVRAEDEAPASEQKAAASEQTASATEEKAPASGDAAAVVNGTVIPMANIDKEMENFQKQLAHMGQSIDDAKLLDMKKNILGRMIDTEILYQESQKKGFTVDDEEANQEMQKIKERFPSEEEFDKQMELSGRTEESLLNDIKRGKAIEKLIDKEVGENIVVSEKDAKEYYDSNPNFFTQPEQVRASHILIKVAPDADEAEKAKAKLRIEEIKQKLDDGADFAELAKEFSEGPSAPRGGDLGKFSRGRMVPSFEEAAFALDVGQVSDVVETQFGYHLIKVVEKEEASTTPFEDIKDKIQEFLKMQKMNEEVGNYLAALKEKADITNNLQ